MSDSNQNPGKAYEVSMFENLEFDEASVDVKIKELLSQFDPNHNRKDRLIQAISMLDLTSLKGNDTPDSISKLTKKALNAYTVNSDETIKTASVCVYQNFIKTVIENDPNRELEIAVVAGGFPAGQMIRGIKVKEIEASVSMGGTEIDVVINRTNVLTGKWPELYNEVRELKVACGKAHLKVILATGELESLTNVAKASMICMMAGADFIKTSTGMEAVNATLPVGWVMTQMIKEYYQKTGVRVGFKPAGGIRTSEAALEWMFLVEYVLGEDWLNKDLFRIGASGLLDDLVKNLSN